MIRYNTTIKVQSILTIDPIQINTIGSWFYFFFSISIYILYNNEIIIIIVSMLPYKMVLLKTDHQKILIQKNSKIKIMTTPQSDVDHQLSKPIQIIYFLVESLCLQKQKQKYDSLYSHDQSISTINSHRPSQLSINLKSQELDLRDRFDDDPLYNPIHKQRNILQQNRQFFKDPPPEQSPQKRYLLQLQDKNNFDLAEQMNNMTKNRQQQWISDQSSENQSLIQQKLINLKLFIYTLQNNYCITKNIKRETNLAKNVTTQLKKFKLDQFKVDQRVRKIQQFTKKRNHSTMQMIYDQIMEYIKKQKKSKRLQLFKQFIQKLQEIILHLNLTEEQKNKPQFITNDNRQIKNIKLAKKNYILKIISGAISQFDYGQYNGDKFFFKCNVSFWSLPHEFS